MNSGSHTDHSSSQPSHSGGSGQRLWNAVRWSAAMFGVVVLLIVLMVVFSPSPAVNWIARPMIVRSLAAEFPSIEFQFGDLRYSTLKNRLECDSVSARSIDGTFSLSTGSIAVGGIGWLSLITNDWTSPEFIEDARWSVHDLQMKAPPQLYGFRCDEVNVSIPDSDVVVNFLEIYPLRGDEHFFRADSFRSTRYRLEAESINMQGVACAELLSGKAFRSRMVTIREPFFNVMVNRDKPSRRAPVPPPLPVEFLNACATAIAVDSVQITNGQFVYSERFVLGEKPAWITFDSVQAQVGGISNEASGPGELFLAAQWKLANAGLLKMSLSIPRQGPQGTFRYAGTVGPMDLGALNTFLEPSDEMRLTRGTLEGASFVVRVDSGRARGYVSGTYRGLKVAVVDGQTGDAGGFSKAVASLIANVFAVRNDNAPGLSEPMKTGVVKYDREHDDTFVQLVWFAVRTGVRDVLGS